MISNLEFHFYVSVAGGDNCWCTNGASGGDFLLPTTLKEIGGRYWPSPSCDVHQMHRGTKASAEDCKQFCKSEFSGYPGASFYVWRENRNTDFVYGNTGR